MRGARIHENIMTALREKLAQGEGVRKMERT